MSSTSASSPDFPLATELVEALKKLEDKNLKRQHRVVQTPCAPNLSIANRPFLAFASNDYLGLANHPELISALQQSAAQWGVSSGASPLVSGYSAAHQHFDERIAAFTQMPAALSFVTGYMANIAVMPALLSRGDEIFADRLNHASLIDGAQLSRAALSRYPHGDLSALKKALTQSTARRKLIVTDAVFSMDGDIAPLADLLDLAHEHQAWLLVDDAHGFGVLGPQGRGSLAQAGLSSPQLILMGTLGKAAGVAGAFVAGSAVLVQYLIQTARPYIFTTASPPALAQTLVSAIDLIEHSDDRRAHLHALITRLRECADFKHWQLLPSATPIQPIIIGDNAQVLKVTRALLDQGIWVPAIRPPTVPVGTARLRVSLSAAHTFDDIERLAQALNALERAL